MPADYQVFNGCGVRITAIYDMTDPVQVNLISAPIETGSSSPVVSANDLNVVFEDESSYRNVSAVPIKILFLYSDSLSIRYTIFTDDDAKQCYYIAGDSTPYYVPDLASLRGYYAIANPSNSEPDVDLDEAKEYTKSTPTEDSTSAESDSSSSWWIILLIIFVILFVVILIAAGVWFYRRHRGE